MIRTVTGDVEKLPGRILTHEHLQIDLGGVKGPHVVINRDDLEDVIHDIEHLQQFGFGSIVDVTAMEIGRDPRTMAGISRKLDIAVVCCTGFYWDPYSEAIKDSALPTLTDALAAELSEGINGGSIRAGVIKIGTRSGEPGETEEKVFRAAVLAHQKTGAPIITHTSEPSQALWQVDALERFGADLSHVLIGHLDYSDNEFLLQVLKRGVFIGIDQISFTWKKPDEERAQLVKTACDNGFADKVILSSDVARKTRLKRHGGTSYSTVMLKFVPLLREVHVSEPTIEMMLTENPNQLLSWNR